LLPNLFLTCLASLLALRAALRAEEASTAFLTTLCASFFLSCNQNVKYLVNSSSTAFPASGVLSESFVCPTNPNMFSGTLTDTIAVKPSKTSPSSSVASLPLRSFCSLAYSVTIFFHADLSDFS